MQYTPKISIITSVYNGRQYIGECIKSVMMQTYPQVEHIIIDGGSTDGTQEILHRYNDHLHYWVSEKDKGIYDAWNKGLSKATGDWIAFVGSDDTLLTPRVLEDAIEQLHTAQKQGIRYVYGKVNLISAGNDVICVWGEPWEKAKKDILQHMTVTHCCAFHHRSLFEEYGEFNDRFRITGDYEFVLREFVKGKDALFTGETLAAMHAGGVSANIRSRLIIARENILARQLNGLPSRPHHRMQVVKAQIAGVLARIVGRKGINILSDFYRTLTGKDKLWSKMD